MRQYGFRVLDFYLIPCIFTSAIHIYIYIHTHTSFETQLTTGIKIDSYRTQFYRTRRKVRSTWAVKGPIGEGILHLNVLT